MATVTFSQVKTAFQKIYGNDPIINSQFDDFDDAFSSAWESFDFFSGDGELTPEAAAESMSDMWQFSEA